MIKVYKTKVLMFPLQHHIFNLCHLIPLNTNHGKALSNYLKVSPLHLRPTELSPLDSIAADSKYNGRAYRDIISATCFVWKMATTRYGHE